MLPFDKYPHGGRQLLGKLKGSNARHGYGYKLIEVTKQSCCAYCGKDLTSSYENWLNLVVDHAIPVSVCRKMGVPDEWCWDFSNIVLACMTCNGFCNRYKVTDLQRLSTLDEFYALRDRIFQEREGLIQARHLKERTFFDQTYGTKQLE